MGLTRNTAGDLVLNPSVGTRMEDLLSRLNTDMMLAVGQGLTDIAGIFDPTPFSDIAGGLFSLVRGDFVGAGLSVVSIVPYVGDAIGKTGKFAKLFRAIEKMQDRLKSMKALFKHVEKGLDPATAKRIKKAIAELDALNQKWESAVEGARDRLEGLFKSKKGKNLRDRANARIRDRNVEGCARKHQRDTVPDDEKKTGAHKNTKGPDNRPDDTYAESNHSPANSANKKVPTDEGGAFQMDSHDHSRAATTGSSREAKLYRDVQEDMINQGKLQDAVDMDRTDSQLKFGDKYDPQFDQLDDFWDDAKLAEF
ncbi:hypothetical protein SCOR_25205 [Sulfidibacter corallicola]|uniref:Uncharacterized protein n=1 Tax=Sulfidibacter corallicola TaxID=2818388 RepID=A0A8A4TT84_SULCO|nr:hypothetical protein [Sulfidibacter corallicola]QTD52298.1 hypothetical protein J3U87_07470 [Sulfidibacter corallicola]